MPLRTLPEILARASSDGQSVTSSQVAFTLGFSLGRSLLQRSKLHRLSCKSQNYAWGRVGQDSKVARLMKADGLAVDESLPYAEFWFGTHPAAPSSVVLDQPAQSDNNSSGVEEKTPDNAKTALLSEWLVENPAVLGRLAPVSGTDGQLPFLFKVLSVNKALSIQAHPDKTLGARLHSERPDVYKDPNHKPEMAVALTDFEAMCGFRPYKNIVLHLEEYPELAKLVGEPVAKAFAEATSSEDQSAGLKALFTAWMKADSETIAANLDALLARLAAQESRNELQDLLLRLSTQYPGDVGIFAPLLLNYLKLRPGQAIFLAANEPHAYLAGDIVECMACSNNVVRAGLTPKLRDVDTLCEMLTYKCFAPEELLVQPRLKGHVAEYVPPIDEFIITRVDLQPGESQDLEPQTSPCIVLVTEGALTLSGRSVSAGATLLEAADVNKSKPLNAAVAADATEPAQLYRVYAKSTFGA